MLTVGALPLPCSSPHRVDLLTDMLAANFSNDSPWASRIALTLLPAADINVTIIKTPVDEEKPLANQKQTPKLAQVVNSPNQQKRIHMACLMNYTIQCKDATTGTTGCFLFDIEHWQKTGEFKAISPIYQDSAYLFAAERDKCKPMYLERIQ